MVVLGGSMANKGCDSTVGQMVVVVVEGEKGDKEKLLNHISNSFNCIFSAFIHTPIFL